MSADLTNRVLSVAALVISILAFLFGGYFSATWAVSVNQRSVVPSVNSIHHESIVLQEDAITIPVDLQERSRQAQFFPDLQSTMTRGALEELLARTRFSDYQAAAINLRAAASELRRENITPAEVANIWSGVRSSDKAVLFTMRSVRLLANELRITEDRIPDLVERFIPDQFPGNATSEDEDEFFRRMAEPEVRAILEQILPMVAEQEISPNAEFLVSLIDGEVPRLDAMASEFVRFSSDIDELLSDYRADTVWDASVKLYNEGGRPAALLPIAAMAVQRPARGNTVVLMRARDLRGNIIVPPGEGVDVVFRASVDDNEGDSLNSLVDAFEDEERDFKLVFQYLDGQRIESATNNFSISVSESLRDSLTSHAESTDLTSDTESPSR